MHIRVGFVALALVAGAAQARANVTVFMNRGGAVDEGVRFPRFGGGDRVWDSLVECVRTKYAPFAVDIVDREPAGGATITAVVGGRASLMGLDDDRVNGIGPYDGGVVEGAVVHVFSQVGPGARAENERDVENLCGVAAHEIGHSLGLEHEYQCGDLMSYFHDECGTETFMDVDASCGAYAEEECATGAAGQNSYRRLGEIVGFRGDGGPRDPDPAPTDPDPAPDSESAPEPTASPSTVTTCDDGHDADPQGTGADDRSGVRVSPRSSHHRHGHGRRRHHARHAW